jgi:hypothetical protein
MVARLAEATTTWFRVPSPELNEYRPEQPKSCEAAGQLTVSNGAYSVPIDLLGQFAAGEFIHTGDGGNRVFIGYSHS